MSKIIKLKKGFDINLKGKAQQNVNDSFHPDTYALKPTDFNGMQRPKILVQEGDNVKAGQPILFDRRMESVKYAAPVSGEIVEIRRGEKRKLLEIRILADKEIEYVTHEKHAVDSLEEIGREKALSTMLESGVWPNLMQRPYGIVANPEDKPKNIFISCFDTHPLAPDYEFIYKDNTRYFQAGITILKKLTEGKVYASLNGNLQTSIFSACKGVETNYFKGPHPAGNVGVHIHHLAPIGKGDIVWTIKPAGVIQIGKLFLEGIYDAEKIIALTGSELKKPEYIKSRVGASVSQYINNNLVQDKVRVVSGNPLTGEKIARDGYLGYYDDQITVLPEGDDYEMFGWILPSTEKLSFHRGWGLLSWVNSARKEYRLNTNTKGEKRTFVQSGVFEKVTPMDIYPVYLLKAILAEDYDEMETLGIFEVVEEDLALCEFVDVSKHDVQAIVRKGINLMLNS